MAKMDEMRFAVRIAQMYYEQGIREPEIARQTGLSQASISRLLTKAKKEGIVRILVTVPQGIYSDLEKQLIKQYGLFDAIVVDTLQEDDEPYIKKDISAAAAYYLETVVKPNEIIGIATWSSTLLGLINSMRPLHKPMNIRLVQLMGGIGNRSAEIHANRLTNQVADFLKGTAAYLPSPGIVGSEASRKVICEDVYVKETMQLFDKIDTAIVGIGALEPSTLLAESGNILSIEELNALRQSGAVGEILLHFYNANGQLIETPLDNRVITMGLCQLQKVKRSIAVAGGKRKYAAILGALRGRWINVLITDHYTASKLVKES